jgi:hypothetical protein
MFETTLGPRTLSGDEAILIREAVELLTDGIRAESELDVALNLGCGPFDALSPKQKLWCTHRVARSLLIEDEPCLPKVALYEATCGAAIVNLEGMVEVELQIQQDESDPEAVQTGLRTLVAAAAKQVEPEAVWPDPECVLIDEWEMALQRIQHQIIPDEDWRMEVMHLDGDPEQVQKIKEFQGIDPGYFLTIAPDDDDIDWQSLLDEIHSMCRNT